MVASDVGFVKVLKKSKFSTYERPLWLTVRASAGHLATLCEVSAGLCKLNVTLVASQGLWVPALYVLGKFRLGHKNVTF